MCISVSNVSISVFGYILACVVYITMCKYVFIVCGNVLSCLRYVFSVCISVSNVSISVFGYILACVGIYYHV